MSNLAKVSGISSITSFDDLSRVSNLFHQSGIFKDATSAAVVAVKILAGQALGLDPFTAISQLHLVQGKPVLSAGLQARLLVASGKYDYDIVEHTETVCTVKIWKLRGGQWADKGNVTFTWDDATKAKLTTKDVWKQYPKNMLFSRCITNAIRWLAPDALGQTVYDPDELNLPVTINADGDTVYTPPEPVKQDNAGLPYKTLEEAINWAVEQGFTETEANDIMNSIDAPKRAVPFFYEIQKRLLERKDIE